MDANKNPKSFSTEAKRANLRQQALSGMEASSLGFVLLGCIGLGYFVGNWLDGRFHSTTWTPLLVVVGAVAGFCEMIRTLMRLSKRSKAATAEDSGTAIAQGAPVAKTNSFYKQDYGTTGDSTGVRKPEPQPEGQQNSDAEVNQIKPRYFTVPEPPQPSYLKASNQGAAKNDVKSAAQNAPDAGTSNTSAARDVKRISGETVAQNATAPESGAETPDANVTEQTLLERLLSDDQTSSQ